MRVLPLALGLLAALACNRPRSGTGGFGFDEDAPGRPPAGFQFAAVGVGRPGRWEVKAAPDAPSGKHVLTQTDLEATKKRYLLALVADPVPGDVSVSVRCKLLAGLVDQACGVVVRHRDDANHYVARMDALDGNVRIYSVKDGVRTAFATYTGPITLGVWHELRVDAERERFVVWLNGRAVIDAHDRTYHGPGRVGLWTKSDVLVQFDDLRVRPAAN